ncbi:peroxiredoxin-5 mitochondrial [Biomphalaria glabrata]|uniref:Peroxiredoxin-5 n=1 Tax=Biomphalaria glabrata TaxID=6526 RepID=A0A9I3VUV4_BIOGL|nr:peroxiredoxin-5; mitochondrial-like peroxiredoxin-5; mitochondrial-like Antioxidative/Oxidative/Resistant factor [Biomphalaria glabrata]
MLAIRSVVAQPSLRGLFLHRFIQTSSSLNMPVKAGDKLPSVDLYEGAPDKKVNTSSFNQGKVVIFGVPGAFTPTCTKDHAPGFVSAVDSLKAKGVKEVVCVSVNDPFVMAAWGRSLDPNGKIRFLADTCAEFAKALDVTLDLTAVLGNVRNKRYALLVDQGVVKKVNLEPDGTGLTCSRASDILNSL